MKILNAQQIRETDQYTIAHEPVKSIDLMERAARQCSDWICKNMLPQYHSLVIFCGPGNNGGDGLAIARQVLGSFNKVVVYIVSETDKYSEDFRINRERLQEINATVIHNIHTLNEFPSLNESDCVIDAIFGTGLNKQVGGLASQVIDNINIAAHTVVSIDIPSGLFADSAVSDKDSIIHADYTLSFQVPKFSFLFAQHFKYVGDFVVLPIGLDKTFMESLPSKKHYIQAEEISKLLIRRKKFDHKGTYGHALLVAGGYQKMGASVLASRACLRSGVGLLTTHIPMCGYEIIQTSVPEAMADVDLGDDTFFAEDMDTDKYDAVGIGPGISTSAETANALKYLLEHSKKPVVIDADALNILAENQSWYQYIPKGSILTPHPKEFERLAGKSKDDFDRHNKLIEFATKHKVHVVLKGAYSCVAAPDGSAYFNSTGNPGMATGGSGDVLTGIITGLLAQGYTPLNAALIGVYIHGLAGDIAARKKTMHAMVAGDIIRCLPAAYFALLRNWDLL